MPGVPAFPRELAAASLLAAGLLAALGRRRRMQLWQRAFGRRVQTPAGEAAAAEVALRVGAADPAARSLDAGLRYLNFALAGQGQVPPAVFAAHLSEDTLDLWVATADRDAPWPWTAVGDGQVWRLRLAALAGLDLEPVRQALAPYPGLVSIGTDATGQVLVDLESAHGLIAVTGPGYLVRAALTAFAAELATSRWSDGMRLTLVGFGADLPVLAPGRVRTFGSLAEAWPELAAHVAAVRDALAGSDAGSVLAGRAQGISPDAWTPHYLIMGVPPTGPDRDRLAGLARSAPGATGFLVAGEVPGAIWTWEITASGRLRAGPLGFDLQVQLLLPGQQRALAELFEVAGRMDGVELTVPPAGPARAGHPAGPDTFSRSDLVTSQDGPAAPSPAAPPPSVTVALLGPVSVRAPGPIEPDHRPAATELVVYLATHPGGVHPNVLAAAIWPRGVTRDVSEALIARVRDWLGADSIGRPQLATDASGRLRFGSQVRVDWQVCCALLAGAAACGPDGRAEGGAEREAGYLARALDLVSGQLVDGREPGRYAWLAADGLEAEVSARVADAAHRLCGLRLAAADPERAMSAARAGLRLAFGDELLWRDLLIAAHATGREDVLRAVVAEVCARAALDEVLPQMAPETEALIDELFPSWRSFAA